VKEIRKWGVTDFSPDTDPGVSGFAYSTLLWGLFCFVKFSDSFMNVVTSAIEVGGDTDSNGAFAGALAGAHLGLSHMPHYFASKVADNGKWNYEELQSIAKETFQQQLQVEKWFREKE